jgi:hypothetical protein
MLNVSKSVDAGVTNGFPHISRHFQPISLLPCLEHRIAPQLLLVFQKMNVILSLKTIVLLLRQNSKMHQR